VIQIIDQLQTTLRLKQKNKSIKERLGFLKSLFYNLHDARKMVVANFGTASKFKQELNGLYWECMAS